MFFNDKISYIAYFNANTPEKIKYVCDIPLHAVE